MHDDEFDGMDEEPGQLWGDRLELKSVGIDIGSSTSHLMFSRLVLRRRGSEYFSGYTVVKRDVTYRSPILLTPFHENRTIDTDRLSRFLRHSYDAAGLTPADVDTGAVITTGEAAKKENAEAIVHLFAEEAGKFVSATAGPNLEAVLAAHGSGAVRHSLRHVDGRHATVLNIDVGGGTTKLAIVRDGRVLETCAINVGARLVAWDQAGVVVRVEDAGRQVAKHMGFSVEVGVTLDESIRRALSAELADLLFEVVTRANLSPLARSLMITPQLSYAGPVDRVIYSGGTAEYVYGCASGEFGDLGPWFGQAIRDAQERWGVPLESAEERIRATVIGASQYTVQVSGNTIFLSDPQLLPLRNLPVAMVGSLPDIVTSDAVAAAVARSFDLLDLEEGAQTVALALNWRHEPEYATLREMAQGITTALPSTIAQGMPVVVIVDSDVAKLLGHQLAQLGFSPVICVDNVGVRQLSFVDIGHALKETGAVPVTVKSLVFL